MKYFILIFISILTTTSTFAQGKNSFQIRIGKLNISKTEAFQDNDFNKRDTIKIDIQKTEEELSNLLTELEEKIEEVESQVINQSKKSKLDALDNLEDLYEREDYIDDHYAYLFDTISPSYEEWFDDLEDRIDDLEDETEYLLKASKLKNVTTRWLSLDYGRSAYIVDNAPKIDGVDPTRLNLWKSHSFTLHIFQQRFNLINHHLNFKYGIGWQTNGYAFEDDIMLLHEPQQIKFDIGDFNFQKNRLRANYAHVPIMLNFESNPTNKNKSFRINAGAYFNFLLNANYKVKQDGNKTKVKENFHLRQFQPGLLLEVGYGKVNFYGNMALRTLFEDAPENNNYTLYPITVGIKLLPF